MQIVATKPIKTTATPIATATDHPPAYSPNMQSRLVCQDRLFYLGEPAYLTEEKNLKQFKTPPKNQNF